MDWIIRISPLAFFDLDETVKWYNYQKPGLGNVFLINFNTSIEKIKNNPYSFRIISEPVRRMVLKKFPFKILYIIDINEIVIIGIVHQKRSNRFLKRRYRK